MTGLLSINCCEPRRAAFKPPSLRYLEVVHSKVAQYQYSFTLFFALDEFSLKSRPVYWQRDNMIWLLSSRVMYAWAL